MRWDAADSGSGGVATGGRADIHLERGQSLVLAYRVPLPPAPRDASPRTDAAAAQSDWGLALAAWVKHTGLRIETRAVGFQVALPQLGGYPVFAAGRAAVVAR